jgi:hypothetical protein
MYFKVNMLGQFKLHAHNDGQITATYIVEWKPVCMEIRAKGMMVWNEPVVEPALAQANQPAAGYLRAR